MKTIILPGYSPKNKEWADEVAQSLDLDHEIYVHNWKHWTAGNFSVKKELEAIIAKIDGDTVNIIAKSVGSRMAGHLIPKLKGNLNKVILCGIASVGKEANKVFTAALSDINPEIMICIQNENDSFVPYEQVKGFIHAINPQIKVIKKERSDHHYPFTEDFQKFLES